jgi:hypothetical protein
MISAFATQMGYIVMLAMAFFFQPTLVDLTKGLAVTMLAPMAIEFVSGIAITCAAYGSARPGIRPTTLVDSWTAGPTEILKDRLHTPEKNDFGSRSRFPASLGLHLAAKAVRVHGSTDNPEGLRSPIVVLLPTAHGAIELIHG